MLYVLYKDLVCFKLHVSEFRVKQQDYFFWNLETENQCNVHICNAHQKCHRIQRGNSKDPHSWDHIQQQVLHPMQD